MQKVVASVLVILAVAFASIPSRTTITPINGTVTGVITNTAGDANAYAPVLYSLWVPEGAASVQFYLNNDNYDDCTYIDLFLLSWGAPCVDDTFDIDGNAFCLMRTYSYSGFYDVSLFLVPGYSSSYLVTRTNQYIYIGVSTESTYTGEACSYTFSASINTTCPAGQLAYATYSDESTCAAPTRGDLSNFTQTVSNASTDSYVATYYFPVAQSTGMVTFTIESTESLYAYGASNYQAGTYNYDCYEYSDYETTDNYTLTLSCIYPEAGYFTLYVYPYSANNDYMNYTISTSVTVCNSTTGGYACAWDAHALDINNLQTINVAVPYVSPVGSIDRYSYWYLDVAANSSFSGVSVTVALGNTTGDEEAYIVYSKNVFPDYDHTIDSDQYNYIYINSETVWLLTFHDFVEAGRIWLGINCNDGTICNITISFNSISSTTTTTTTGPVSTTTGTASTGTTTTGTASTGTTTTGTASTGTTTTGTASSTTLTTQPLTTQPVTTSIISITTSGAASVMVSMVILMVALLF